MSALERYGWDLIEDSLIDVESTVSVFELINAHVGPSDDEGKASALDTMTRHLQADMKALRGGLHKAMDRYELTEREPARVADVVAFPTPR